MKTLMMAIDLIISPKVFKLDIDRLGFGPTGSRKDDQVGNHFVIVGICYVVGLAGSEALRQFSLGNYAMETFEFSLRLLTWLQAD